MLSAKRLADYLNISERQARRHIRRGMPTNDGEAAVTWYLANVQQLQPRNPHPRRDPMAGIVGPFVAEFADVLRDAIFHWAADRTPPAELAAMIVDPLRFLQDWAAAHGWTPKDLAIEAELRLRRRLSEEQKAKADARAAKRWAQAGQPEKLQRLTE